ncbi:RNA polymerase sigma factor, FliA/WhiG [Candidatus Magnetoovum chiemensis]|nr:RNA polymerase sigma factor, FliA/WhiG [Candidatus Magnetoovum chiemensis]
MYKTSISDEKKEEIIKEFLPYIKYSALRLLNRIPPQLTIDDLVSVGIIGLLDAIENYEPSKAKLKTYAEFRIKGSMLDELRAADSAPRSLKEKINDIKAMYVKLEKTLGRPPEDVEVCASLNISIDDYYKTLNEANTASTLRFEDFTSKVGDYDDINIVDNIPDTASKDPLSCLIEESKKQQLARLIDELPYKEKLVLSLYYWDELTMKEIAKVLKVSEGRVSQLHSQAVLRLKAKLNTRSIEQ